MSGSRAVPRGGRPHPAVIERRRQIARAKGRRRRAALIAALAAGAAAALLWWLWTGPLLAVSGVSLSGYDRPDAPALKAAISRAASTGTVLSPPVDRIRLAAASFPWVASVSVARDWPRGVSVQVTMARPAAVAAGVNGAALVSPAGRVLAPVAGHPALGWLTVPEAVPAPGYAIPDASRAALEFISAARPEVARRVRGLRIDRQGLLVGRLAGGPELRLGQPQRLAAKAASLGLLLAQLSPQDEQGATYIDLSVPERPALGGAAKASITTQGSATPGP